MTGSLATVNIVPIYTMDQTVHPSLINFRFIHNVSRKGLGVESWEVHYDTTYKEPVLVPPSTKETPLVPSYRH
ncbi:hypothetical protein HK096_003948, partial [Nowakowskiella sp. JEL0078]